MTAYEDALTVWTKQAAPMDWASDPEQSRQPPCEALGERAQDDALLRDAVTAHEDALTVRTKEAAPMDWATTARTISGWRCVGAAPSRRRPGISTRPRPRFSAASKNAVRTPCRSSGQQTQWNLGDLALARFAVEPDPALLDTAERHVGAARAVFAEGSDHQTDRCDELMRRIAEARLSA